MDVENLNNIGSPGGRHATTCGYCSPAGQRSKGLTSHHSATLQAVKLSSSVYQGMIDRGWRRSGTYCYKPNLKLSCCPQYTIKLDALAFKPSRSQRKLINRWNRFIMNGQLNAMEINETKHKKLPVFTSLLSASHELEASFQIEHLPSLKFEVLLEPSSYSSQKFELYKKYQSEVHHDIHNTPKSFKRFLVDSPLQNEAIPYPSQPPSHLPLHYGSYHQLYLLDGQLIALGVIDVLPKCVSSVYFMYDATYERYSLGKLSALQEISLACEIHDAGINNMANLYMGFYIHSCQKMRYKGDFSPSYLADPETYEWYPLETCRNLLDKHRYACFSQPSRCKDDVEELEANNDIVGNKRHKQSDIDLNRFQGINILSRSDNEDIISIPLLATPYLSFPAARAELEDCVEELGPSLAKEMNFVC